MPDVGAGGAVFLAFGEVGAQGVGDFFGQSRADVFAPFGDLRGGGADGLLQRPEGPLERAHLGRAHARDAVQGNQGLSFRVRGESPFRFMLV